MTPADLREFARRARNLTLTRDDALRLIEQVARLTADVERMAAANRRLVERIKAAAE